MIPLVFYAVQCAMDGLLCVCVRRRVMMHACFVFFRFVGGKQKGCIQKYKKVKIKFRRERKKKKGENKNQSCYIFIV